MSLREIFNGTTVADRVLLAILLFLSLTGFVFFKEVLPRAEEVTIEVEGKVVYRYPLDSDRMVKVESRYGNLTVEIKGKKVRVVGASCPNRLCEHQGWIERGGIICLPNRISVVVGHPRKPDRRGLDAITG